MTERPHIRVEMLSNPLYLSGARELVAAVADRLGFPEESCGHIKLAVDEALCNVIRHGYDRRPDGPIWMSLWPLSDSPADGRPAGGGPGLLIVIEDEARQVDPDQIRSRSLDEVRPGGLGVHIIGEVMDDVKYEKRNGAGMRLTMLKRLNPALKPAVPGKHG
jgi:anti-sigma regulatory factor (Ser/Thr protein kinase)